VNRRLYVWYLECYSSCVTIRCQETASGDCNRLRTPVCVCQWAVICSHESWVYKWLINPISNPNFVNIRFLSWENLSLSEEDRLRVFENMGLRRISGTKRDRKWHKDREKFIVRNLNIFTIKNVIKIIKSRGTDGWAMWHEWNRYEILHTQFWTGNLNVCATLEI
jgi:hypothetical protein